MQIIKWNWSILDQYFDENTMSVHWKVGCQMLHKWGRPWEWWAIYQWDERTENAMRELVWTMLLEVEHRDDSWLEIDRKYSKVLQLGPYRTVIVDAPLADHMEITVVKPVKKLDFDDYNFEQKTLDAIMNAQGMMIAGAPWEGKTTFAQALVDQFVRLSKIIKTIESPRDLNVDKKVVQYSFNYAPHSEIRDILLLSRPDVAIYDEVRNIEDFLLFKDLRLTGIGLVWVIHATKPVDAIQRLIWTIEMGMIPEIVDTICYIKWWTVAEILTLKHVVKVPSGLMSEDLARPVIEVYSLMKDKLAYELYSFWEQVVVMPLEEVEKKKKDSLIFDVAAKEMTNIVRGLVRVPFYLEVVGGNSINIYVQDSDRGEIIGKWWEKIQALESKLGLSISVKWADETDKWFPVAEPRGEKKHDKFRGKGRR